MKIKMMTDDAYNHLIKNIKYITKKIQDNDSNEWIYHEFPEPIFVEKSFEINDIILESNPDSKNKTIDFNNSINLYEGLKHLPRYVLTDDKFWLWLHFELFYKIVKEMMTIKSETTILDHWTHKQGVRRGIFFGVLSRCYFRVSLTVDERKADKYELSKWVIENPERFRNLTWRSYSSENHIVRGAVRGEMRSVIDSHKENNDIYDQIGKYISQIGSVRLLDVISEEDVEQFVYQKALELLSE